MPGASFVIVAGAAPSVLSLTGSALHACDVNKKKDDEKKKKANQAKSARKLTPGQAERRRKRLENEKKREAEQKAAYEKRRKKSLPILKEQIQFAAAAERKAGIRRVVELREGELDDFIPLLIEFAASDRDPGLREVSIQVLGRLKIKKAEKVMLAGLDDVEDRVKLASVSALQRIEAKGAAAPKMAIMLEKEDFEKQNHLLTALIRALAKFEDKSKVEFLKKKAGEEETHIEVQQTIILYFGKAKATAAYDFLLKLAEDEEKNITSRSYAVNSLGRLKDKRAIKPVRKLLENIRTIKSKTERVKYNRLKLQIITALVRLGDEKVEQDLYWAAKDDDSNVRVNAINQIGELRLKKARPMLCYKFKYDNSKSVRRAARKAVNRIDGKDELNENREIDEKLKAKDKKKKGK